MRVRFTKVHPAESSRTRTKEPSYSRERMSPMRQPGNKMSGGNRKYFGQKQNDNYIPALSTTFASLDKAPSSPKCGVKDETDISSSPPCEDFSNWESTDDDSCSSKSSASVCSDRSPSPSPCEDFSESWHCSNWEINDNDDHLRSSAASVSSSNSLYIDLDEFDEDDIDEPAYIIEKKRKNLRNVLRADEDIFQTSLKSLNISERNMHDLHVQDGDPLDLIYSDRQDESNKGDFNENVLSFLSSYHELGGCSRKEPSDSRDRTSPIRQQGTGGENKYYGQALSTTFASLDKVHSSPNSRVKDETACEDFSESQHFSHWESNDCGLRYSNSSASVCSSDSLYIDDDDIEEPTSVVEKERKSLRHVVRAADEDLFQTSLNSVNISKRRTRDLSFQEGDPLDLSNSERQDDSYRGDFNESVLSFTSSC